MSAVPKRMLTPAEYLAIERAAEFKSEFYAGEMFAMAGASLSHIRAKDNLARHLGNKLQNGPCVALTSDLRVTVPRTRFYTYPDIVVVCGEPEFEDDHQDILVNPTVIVEVLSPSTQSYDRGAKLRQYRQILSLREYILVEQEEPVIEQLVLLPNGKWEQTIITGLESSLILSAVAAEIPLRDIYAGVKFPEKPPRG